MDDETKAKLAKFLKGEIAYMKSLPSKDSLEKALDGLKKLQASTKELQKTVDGLDD